MQQGKQINPTMFILCSNSYRASLCLLYYITDVFYRYTLCYEWVNDTNSIAPTATAERLYRRPNDQRQWSIINNNKLTYSLRGWLINWSTMHRGRYQTPWLDHVHFFVVFYQTRSTLCAHNNNIIIIHTCKGGQVNENN